MTLSDLTKQAEKLRMNRSRGAFPIKASGPVVAIEWDGPVLRIAQASGGSKPVMTRFATERVDHSFDVAKPDAAAAGACLAKTLQKHKIKPGAIVMGIPRALIFLRTLSLPKPGSADEAASMVHFQINKDLPFRPDEAIIDFQINELPPAPPVLSENKDQSAQAVKVDALVAVVKKDIAQYYEAVAQAAGLKLAALGLDSYSSARGLAGCGLISQQNAVAVVSLRQSEVIIDVVAGNSLVFSRTAGLPRVAESDPESALGAQKANAAALVETVTIEVVRSLHNYEGLERHLDIEAILVSGDSGQELAIVDALAQRYNIPCSRLNPADAVKVNEGSSETEGALTVFGLAIAARDSKPWPYDFLHPKRPPVPKNTKRRRIIAIAAAAAFVFIVVMGIRSHLVSNREKIRDEIQAEIVKEQKNQPIYREMRLKAKTVREWTVDKRPWLDHYAYLSTLLPGPSDVYATSIQTGARGMMHIAIQARSGDILAQMDKSLRDAGYDLKPLAITPSSDKYGYSFQSTMQLVVPEKIKTNVTNLKPPPRPADDNSLNAGKKGAQGRRNR